MSEIATVGLDLAKNVFQLLGGDGDVWRRTLLGPGNRQARP